MDASTLRAALPAPGARLLRGGPPSWALLAALGALLTAVMAALEADTEPVSPDSREYLAFSPLRPWSYPALLRLAGLFGDPVAIVPPVQIALAGGAAVLLAGTVATLTRSVLAGAAVLVLLLANPVVFAYHHAILTESLATTLLTVALALLLRLLHRPSPGWFYGLCAVGALGWALRPAGAVFLPFLLVVALFAWRWLGLSLRPLLAALALMAAAGQGGAIGANALVHGEARSSSNLGTGLFGKALLLAPGVEDRFAGSPHEADLRRVAAVARPAVEALERIDDPRLRMIIGHDYVNFLRFGVLFPEWAERAGRADSVARNRTAGTLAMEILRHDPAGYLRLTAWEFAALLVLPPISTVAEQRAWRAELERLAPWPYDGASGLNREDGERRLEFHVLTGDQPEVRARPAFLVHAFRAVHAVFHAAGLAALAWVLVRPGRSGFAARAIAAAALLYLGTLAMTALGDVGGVRYTVPIWPCVALVLALLVHGALPSTPRFTGERPWHSP
ncbi:MAG TPA: hypothetical protein VD995_12695 [Azospirillum sp.]|nr:hypothetical protein [Azospirillum sp.]